MGKLLIFFVPIYLFATDLSGQCPDKSVLWNRITYLRDSTNAPPDEQIAELTSDLTQIKNCSEQQDSVVALLYVRIGWLLSLQKNYSRAIEYTNQGIQIIQHNPNKPGINTSHLIRYYNNLQILYDSTGNSKMQKRATDSCIALSLRLKTGYYYSVQHISNKIVTRFVQGDYYRCIQLAIIGEDISKNIGFRSEDFFYYVCWEINALIFLQRYSEASEKVNKALAECRRLKEGNYMGTLLGLKANIAEKNGTPEEAVKFSHQSFIYEKKAKNPSGCAATLSNLGLELYFKKLHKYDIALLYFNEALIYANANDSLYILNNIANVYVQTHDFIRAFDYYQKAFDKIHPFANETFFLNGKTGELLNLWNVEYVFNLVLDKAEAYIKLYFSSKKLSDLRFALEIYKTADRLADKIKVNQTDLTTKLFWRTDSRRLYEHAIESCYLSGNLQDAFYFFEKSRAVLLNDQLKEQETDDPSISVMTSIIKKNLDLENRLDTLDKASAEYADIVKTIYTNKIQLSQIEENIRDKNPWYYQSLIDTNFIDIESVKNKLLGIENKTAIFEFFNGDSSVYLLIIKPGYTGIKKIDKLDFDNTVDRFTAYLSSATQENQDYKGFMSTSFHLYKLVFGDSVVPSGRVVVSPDGKYFPLEALITTQDTNNPQYFLNDHIVSYTYSIRFLLNDFKKNKPDYNQNFLGLAPINYPTMLNLASLYNSDVSLKKISSYFKNSHTLTGLEATRSQFIQLFYNCRIVQLYTHATDSGSHGEPVIYFADSLLSLSELIPDKKVATQLIVLSACETGNGKLYQGEGVFSFNRGFAALGIPSSISNIWSVNNESTYKLTELFYKYIAQGLLLDVALQKAKLEFISSSSKEKKLPYYWAASILVGKSDTIENKTHTVQKWIILAGGVFILGVLIWFIRRKQQ